MFKTLKNLVLPRNSQNTYLTSEELGAIHSTVQRASASLEAARILSEKGDLLVEEAIKAVYVKFPYVTQAQGSNHAFTPEDKAKCSQDIGYYLQIIVYCLVAGNSNPIDQYLLSEIHEPNRDLELSRSWYIEALKYIKDNSGLSGNAALEANTYFDYVINALS